MLPLRFAVSWLRLVGWGAVAKLSVGCHDPLRTIAEQIVVALSKFSLDGKVALVTGAGRGVWARNR
ncbi:MAG: hypothetical protein KME16_02915 [Scytolyngbya sp. HA4215-MV1]|nr:hypothetical protein [Scytolyngbya sp. HA4215-MV1]